jgi:hypothetical protein
MIFTLNIRDNSATQPIQIIVVLLQVKKSPQMRAYCLF